MIIDFSLKCNTYSEKAEEEIIACKCPDCPSPLKRYSTYDRWALTLETDGFGSLTIKPWRLTIIRVKCAPCNKTHALLPGDIIPYKQYSIDTLVTILSFILEGKMSVAASAKLFGIPQQVIYSILKQWSVLIYKLVLLLRDSFAYYIAIDTDTIKLDVVRFITKNIDRAPKAYLKYYKWPLFMTWNQNADPQKVSIGMNE